jgi:hypothetical protein
VQFTVGLKLKGKTDRVVVDTEDALIAALKAKTERPPLVAGFSDCSNLSLGLW